MQFSDTSNLTGIIEDITFQTGLDTNAYTLKDRTRNINHWYYMAVLEAWKASSDWEFDDTNQTGFPIATTTMVASQPDYTIPSNALKIRRVEVKDEAGNWSVVRPLDETQVGVALDEFYKTDGLPKWYRIERASIILYPAPAAASVTETAGLKLYFLREMDEFASTDTTQEPGIAEPFHRLLSYGASYDQLLKIDAARSDRIKVLINEKMQQLRDFYSGRHLNFKTRLRPTMQNYM